MDIAAIHVQLVGNVVVGHMQSHAVPTQDPYLQGLMRPGINRVGQIIQACVTGRTLIARTAQCRVIKAALDDLCGLTRGTRDAVWPVSLADGLSTLPIIDPMLDIALQRGTPVRVWATGCPQCAPSSHATTLASNMSQEC